MRSDRRLHPLSFLFAMSDQLRQLLLPALALLFTARSSGGNWDLLLLWGLIPVALFALVRALSYRYRLDEDELVVRTGFIFRNERHIPYSRIQNIEAIQSVAHRALSVAEVRIETGSGKEDDATMRVVPIAEYVAIRERVLATRAARVADAEAPAAPPAESVVLSLPARELLVSGLVDNRSAVLIAAGLGVVWELGLGDYLFDLVVGDRASRRSYARQAARAMFEGELPGAQTVLFGAAGLVILFAAVTVLSMAWSYVRLYGFVLRRAGDDLRTEYGLLTRVATTIPLRRIQTLTVFQGPLYTLFGRASVRVETAGGEAGQEGASAREPLAPVIRQVDLGSLLEHVLPGLDLSRVTWEPPASGAFGRKLRQSAIAAVLLSLLFVMMLGPWTLALLAIFLALAVVHARRFTASLGWAAVDGAVLFRRGWIWRRVTVARFSKMQVVALHRSPFDRRTGMARLRVDTAGAASPNDRIDIPYLPADVAGDLHARLAGAASGTSFQW